MGFYEKVKNKVKEYQEAAPERRKKELEKLDFQLEREERREKIRESKSRQAMKQLSIQERRTNLMQKRQSAMPQMPSLMNFGGPQSLPRSPLPTRNTGKPKQRKGKRKKRK